MTLMEPVTSNLSFYNFEPAVSDIKQEVLTGLRNPQPTIHPKFFYNARGSKLFEAITRQPEYYPTATEKKLLRQIAPELSALMPSNMLLAEPGAGNCEKVRLILDHWRPRAYMPIEISHDELLDAARALATENPDLPIHAVRADYTAPIEWPDEAAPPRLVFFPGSTLGNFEPTDRAVFLRRLRELAGDGGGLLLGVDLHKDSAVLNAAYNDAAGRTAAFNQNILHHLNDILDAGFQPDEFDHVAFYNENSRRIEMHLRCRNDQHINIGGEQLKFAAGDTFHTENSYKFNRSDLESYLEEAGFRMRKWWETDDPAFGLCLADSV